MLHIVESGSRSPYAEINSGEMSERHLPSLHESTLPREKIPVCPSVHMTLWHICPYKSPPVIHVVTLLNTQPRKTNTFLSGWDVNTNTGVVEHFLIGQAKLVN